MESNDKLYHYTTPDALIGIIESKTLWATDAFYLNDSDELLGGYELFRTWLAEFRDSTTNKKEQARIDWLLHDIRDAGKPDRSLKTFVCSLTTQGDQLSQWRAYCRGGGFCIGFPADQLKESGQSQGFELHSVIYDLDEQSDAMMSIIDSRVRPWVQEGQLPVDDNKQFKVSGMTLDDLARFVPKMKHKSFEEEHEWRLISQIEPGFDAAKYFFRSRNGMVVPYRKIALPEDPEFWNKVEIKIGPTPYPEESKASVRALFRRHHPHTCALSVTETPYREL